jgi:hypothetical protein
MPHNKCYDQPTHAASAGATTRPEKVSGDIKNDALGNPDRFTRETKFEVKERSPKALRKKQLGSNGYQSTGFSSTVAERSSPAPRRGLDKK